MCTGIAEFVRYHRSINDGQRLGQRFASMYCKHPCLDIRNETDDAKAVDLIIHWLVQNHYYETLPEPVITVTQ